MPRRGVGGGDDDRPGPREPRGAALAEIAGAHEYVLGGKNDTRVDDAAVAVVAEALVEGGPNRTWVADLTRLVTGEGVLWLASVRDAFANRVVGWAVDPRATTTLVLAALDHALASRQVHARQLIFHSDKGAQYTALRFTQRLVDAGVAPSTGSTGDSFDCEHPVVVAGRSLTLVMTGPAGALALTCRPRPAATPLPAGRVGGDLIGA